LKRIGEKLEDSIAEAVTSARPPADDRDQSAPDQFESSLAPWHVDGRLQNSCSNWPPLAALAICAAQIIAKPQHCEFLGICLDFHRQSPTTPESQRKPVT
jgi:hypothetical protein